jgi:ADP-ribose pyrophosphatase
MIHRGVQTDPSVSVVGSRRAHEGPLLLVDIDQVRLPGGTIATLESIRHPGAAAALPVLPDGRVLLVRQYRHAMGGWILEVPAGKLDPGEPPDRCARREVEEEVGYRVGSLRELGAIFTTPGFTDEIIWLYEARELTPTELAHEQDEVIEVQVWDFEAALSAVQDGRIRDAKTVATILHAAMERRSSATNDPSTGD